VFCVKAGKSITSNY